MTRQSLIVIAAGGSVALLIGAFAFQYIGGLRPCVLCLWQRWPHGVAAAIGLGALVVRGRALPVLGALAALVAAGLGLFHAGVELHWWAGLSTCSAGSVADVAPDALLDQILAAPVVRCDDVAWSFAGVSMAGWNAIVSAGLVLVWLAALRATGPSQRA